MGVIELLVGGLAHVPTLSNVSEQPLAPGVAGKMLVKPDPNVLLERQRVGHGYGFAVMDLIEDYVT